jgi:hypothetical protein
MVVAEGSNKDMVVGKDNFRFAQLYKEDKLAVVVEHNMEVGNKEVLY